MDEKLHPRETFPRQQAAPTFEKALVCISDVMGTQLGRTCKNHQGNGAASFSRMSGRKSLRTAVKSVDKVGHF